MTHFEWTPDLETGHADIDAQHKSLFELANRLEDALGVDDADDEAIADAIWGLSDYVIQHFQDEEALMLESGYTQVRAHKLQHARLSSETLRFVADYFNGETVAATRLAPFITSWLREHILAEDVNVARHLHAAE